MRRENDLSSSSLSWSSTSPLPRRPPPCLRVRLSASLLSGPLSFFLSYIYLPGSLGGLVNAPPTTTPQGLEKGQRAAGAKRGGHFANYSPSGGRGRGGDGLTGSLWLLHLPSHQPVVSATGPGRSPCSPSAQVPSLARRGAHPRAPIQGKARSQLRLNWAL